VRICLIFLIFISASIINVEATGHPEPAEDQVQRLVATSAERLAIAEQVALAKWDTGAPVEDETRELQVINHAVIAGKARGLKPDEVSRFFRAQIEANKLVQYSLLADWRRVGRAPNHQPVSLSLLRPRLDQLQIEVIGELSDTASIRASSSCSSYIAKAVGKYLSAHEGHLGSLESIALDRSLAATCTG
jgi:chorismate mutase